MSFICSYFCGLWSESPIRNQNKVVAKFSNADVWRNWDTLTLYWFSYDSNSTHKSSEAWKFFWIEPFSVAQENLKEASTLAASRGCTSVSVDIYFLLFWNEIKYFFCCYLIELMVSRIKHICYQNYENFFHNNRIW